MNNIQILLDNFAKDSIFFFRVGRGQGDVVFDFAIYDKVHVGSFITCIPF